MKNKIKFKTTSRIMAGICRFVGNNINSNDFEQIKAKYIERKKLQLKKRDTAIILAELEKNNTFDISLYERTGIPDEKFGPFVMGISTVRYDIMSALWPNNVEYYKEIGKIEIQLGANYPKKPPEIKHSEKAFGLIFE